MKLPKLYWFGFLRGLRVTYHFPSRDRLFAWTQIRGVQVGGWFIGAVKGSEVEEPDAREKD